MQIHRVVSFLVLGACAGLAQTPDLSGVWKANLSQSRPGDPYLKSYQMLLEQSAGSLKETADTVSRYGPYRFHAAYNFNGRPFRDSVRGIPARSRASWEGGRLVVETQIFNTKPESIRRTYTLASGGRTLTLETSGTLNGQPLESTLLFEKQPGEAGETLRRPEQTASQRFKNVQVLKDMPASQFIDLMHYFTLSLGQECEMCHKESDFASDELKDKVVARKMITMTMQINEQYFDGKTEVRCYSCHHGARHPHIAPMPAAMAGARR